MKKNFLALIPLVLALLILLTGCITIGGGRSIRGTGQMVTREIDVADFSAIDVSGNFRIVYRHAPVAGLTVVMQENLFNHLETSVRGGNLQVRARRNFDTTGANRPTLYIYAPNLTAADFTGAVSASGWDTIRGQSFAIEATGAASLTLDLDVERLEMNISGAASATLTGSAGTINIDGSGAFNLRAGDLQIQDGRVNVSGAANVTLSTLDNVNVNASGLARVRAAD